MLYKQCIHVPHTTEVRTVKILPLNGREKLIYVSKQTTYYSITKQEQSSGPLYLILKYNHVSTSSIFNQKLTQKLSVRFTGFSFLFSIHYYLFDRLAFIVELFFKVHFSQLSKGNTRKTLYSLICFVYYPSRPTKTYLVKIILLEIREEGNNVG